MHIQVSNVTSQADPHTNDPPPSYTPPQPAARDQTNAPPGPSAVQPRMPNACNFLALFRPNDSIRGTYTIDPDMCIPASLLPPLGRGESENDRKNLKLESCNGLIDVEIFLLGERAGNGVKTSRRTSIDVKSSNGSVSVKLVRLAPFLSVRKVL